MTIHESSGAPDEPDGDTVETAPIDAGVREPDEPSEPSEPEIFDAPALDAPALDAPALERPRVRWAGIVWGLAFATVAVLGLRLTLAPDALELVSSWATSATVSTLVAAGLLTIGAALLLGGVVGLLRRAQRRTQRHTA